jgi:hypothetical protein
MQVNTVPTIDTSHNFTGCCPKFDPAGWDNQTLHFKDKLFVRSTTKSAMHVPLNMGRVFARVQEHIEDAGAADPAQGIVLSRDLSPWASEHFFAVTKDVKDEQMTTLTGDFVTSVFEGPYAKAKDWGHQKEAAEKAASRGPKRVFMFYTTCPQCAKAYGKNYVIGVAEI